MIIVIGEILIDIFPEYRRIGGAPFNFAFHLKKLGFPVRLISRVGDDANGRRILGLLDENGLDTAGVQIDPRHPTGTVRVTLDASGVPRFDICENAAYDHLDLSRGAVPDYREAKMIYFGTLIQRSDDGCRRLQRLLARLGDGCVRFCDINLRPPHINPHSMAASLHQADLLKLNEDELASIQGAFHGPPTEAELFPWLMESFAIGAVALTRGGRGSTLVRRDETIHAPAVEGSTLVDTVGAGDGYAAILAAGHIGQIPWIDTIRLASRFAGRICGIPGAVPSEPTFYDDFRPLMRGGAHAC